MPTLEDPPSEAVRAMALRDESSGPPQCVFRVEPKRAINKAAEALRPQPTLDDYANQSSSLRHPTWMADDQRELESLLAASGG